MPLKNWEEGLDRIPQAVGAFNVEADNIALLSIDMQYFSAHKDYGVLKNHTAKDPEAAQYYADRLEIITPNCAKLFEFFRANNRRIFHACFGASLLDGGDLHPLRQAMHKQVPAFTTEDFEYQIREELTPQRGELIISKSTRSAFTGTALDQKMRMAGIKTVVVVGVATEVCVSSSARSAWDLGYNVVLIDDATAAFTDEDQILTMRNWAAFFGKVMDTDELIDDLAAKVGAPATGDLVAAQ